MIRNEDFTSDGFSRTCSKQEKQDKQENVKRMVKNIVSECDAYKCIDSASHS